MSLLSNNISNQTIKHSGSCDCEQMFSVLKINESQPPFFPQQVSFDNVFLDIQTPAERLCSNFGLLEPPKDVKKTYLQTPSFWIFTPIWGDGLL